MPDRHTGTGSLTAPTGSIVFALFGVVAIVLIVPVIILSLLDVDKWLLYGHPASSPETGAERQRTAYERLSDLGRGFVYVVVAFVGLVVLIAIWAVVAVLAAVGVASLAQGTEGPAAAIAGIAALGVFLTVLFAGPIVTLRSFKRRPR